MIVPTTMVIHARPGLHAWAQLVLTEAKLVWRDPAGIVLPLALPLTILVMNSLDVDRTGVPELGGLAALDVYVTPLSLVMVLAMVGMINVPSHLATYRATRVLRRLAATPAHPAMVLVAQVLVNLALAAAGVAVALGIAFTALGVASPRNPGGALLALALAAAGYVRRRHAHRRGHTVGQRLHRHRPAGVLRHNGARRGLRASGEPARLPRPRGEHTPFGAALDALSASWAGRAASGAQTVALVLTTLIAGALAARLFRWE